MKRQRHPLLIFMLVWALILVPSVPVFSAQVSVGSDTGMTHHAEHAMQGLHETCEVCNKAGNGAQDNCVHDCCGVGLIFVSLLPRDTSWTTVFRPIIPAAVSQLYASVAATQHDRPPILHG